MGTVGRALNSIWDGLRRLLPGSSAQAEARLLRICRGSVEQMNRLIAYEKKRVPNLSHRDACLSAIERYRRDQ